MLLVIFLFSTTLFYASRAADRAVWIAGESGIDSNHPGKCWSETLNREINVGEEVTDKTKCELIRCNTNFGFSKRVCPQRRPQPGCLRKKPDSTKNYPECCGLIECPPVKIDY